MNIKNYSTDELVSELVRRGARLIENEPYKKSECCHCKEKYSHSADVKVLKKVLVLDTIQEVD